MTERTIYVDDSCSALDALRLLAELIEETPCGRATVDVAQCDADKTVTRVTVRI